MEEVLSVITRLEESANSNLAEFDKSLNNYIKNLNEYAKKFKKAMKNPSNKKLRNDVFGESAKTPMPARTKKVNLSVEENKKENIPFSLEDDEDEEETPKEEEFAVPKRLPRQKKEKEQPAARSSMRNSKRLANRSSSTESTAETRRLNTSNKPLIEKHSNQLGKRKSSDSSVDSVASISQETKSVRASSRSKKQAAKIKPVIVVEPDSDVDIIQPSPEKKQATPSKPLFDPYKKTTVKVKVQAFERNSHLQSPCKSEQSEVEEVTSDKSYVSTLRVTLTPSKLRKQSMAPPRHSNVVIANVQPLSRKRSTICRARARASRRYSVSVRKSLEALSTSLRECKEAEDRGEVAEGQSNNVSQEEEEMKVEQTAKKANETITLESEEKSEENTPEMSERSEAKTTSQDKKEATSARSLEERPTTAPPSTSASTRQMNVKLSKYASPSLNSLIPTKISRQPQTSPSHNRTSTMRLSQMSLSSAKPYSSRSSQGSKINTTLTSFIGSKLLTPQRKALIEQEEQRKREFNIKIKLEEERLRKQKEQLNRKLKEKKKKREERERRNQMARDAQEQDAQKQQKAQEEKEKVRLFKLREETMLKNLKKKQQEMQKTLKEEEDRKAAKQRDEQQKREKEDEVERMKATEEKLRLEREAREMGIVKKKEEERKAANQKSAANSTFTVDESGDISSYEITPRNVVIISDNPENYSIDDLDSGQSTDEESQPRKPVPKWAQGTKLREALVNLWRNPVDIDEIFSYDELMKELRLEDIFSSKRKRFFKRTSSAVWDTPVYIKRV